MSENVHAIPMTEVEKRLGAAQKLEVKLGENRLDDGSKLWVKEVKNRFRRLTLDLQACQLASGTTATMFRKFEDGYAGYQLRDWQKAGMEDVELRRGDRLVVGFEREGRPVLLELV